MSANKYPKCLRRPDRAGHHRTRTLETEAAYRSRYQALRKRAAAAAGHHEPEKVSVAEVAHWLSSKVSQFRPATVRQYRASINQALRDLWDAKATPRDDIKRLAEFVLVRSRSPASTSTPRRPIRTSAGRAKGFAVATAAALIHHASRSGQPAASDLVDYLEFGPRLGLRLCEWPKARLEGADLIVPCGKYSAANRRGLAPERRQKLLFWDDHSLNRLDRFLLRLRSTPTRRRGGRPDLSMRRLGRLLRRIRRDAGAPRVTLRSCRHQFCANLRASGYSREERAAALGHAAADTSDQHYGKRNRGWRGLRRWLELPPDIVQLVRPGAKTSAKLRDGKPLTRAEARCGPPSPAM